MTHYGGIPLAKNNVKVRQQLQSDLYQMNTVAISKRDDNDKRIIMKSFSRAKVPGLIIHKRLLVDNTLVEPLTPNNLCIECTILLPGGEEDPNFTLVLFLASDVGAYLTRNKMNLVVSLLQRK